MLFNADWSKKQLKAVMKGERCYSVEISILLFTSWFKVEVFKFLYDFYKFPHDFYFPRGSFPHEIYFIHEFYFISRIVILVSMLLLLFTGLFLFLRILKFHKISFFSFV